MPDPCETEVGGLASVIYPPFSLVAIIASIAASYPVDRVEIAHELGMDPEPNWFSTEGDVDHDPESDREKRDAWRAWFVEYNTRVHSDPVRYQRIVAKIKLRYATLFLSMAGSSTPGFKEIKHDPHPAPDV